MPARLRRVAIRGRMGDEADGDLFMSRRAVDMAYHPLFINGNEAAILTSSRKRCRPDDYVESKSLELAWPACPARIAEMRDWLYHLIMARNLMPLGAACPSRHGLYDDAFPAHDGQRRP